MLKWIRNWMKRPKAEPPKHEHAFTLQYRTGNSNDGKTEVLKCDCGQWAIRPYGASEYTMIKQ